MNCKCIAYFTEDRIPLSLRKLNYNRFYNMTDIFIAAAESGDYEELFERLKKVLLDDISVKETTERYICFSVNGNNLKFKKETACLKREVDIMTTRKQIMVGDDVSGLKIYEIINRYFGKQYSGWMKAWYDHQIANLKEIRDRTRTWAENCLRPYFDMVPTTGKKIRSYEMPGGVLKLAKQEPEYEVTDAELVPWLEKNQLEKFVAVKKEARWGDFKETLKNEKKQIRTVAAEDGTLQVVTEDGEVVPGIRAVPRDDKFTIKCK